MSNKNALYVIAGSILISIVTDRMKGSKSEEDNIYDMARQMMKRKRKSVDQQVAHRQERKQKALEMMYNEKRRDIERTFAGKAAREEAIRKLEAQFTGDPLSTDKIRDQWGEKITDMANEGLGFVKTPSSFRDKLEMDDAELSFRPKGKTDRETFFHDHRR